MLYMTQTLASRTRPVPTFLPPYPEDQVHLEIDVRPGTLLGGPFCSGRPRVGCELLGRLQIGERHLGWLREEYRKKGEVYRKLNVLAHQHRFSRSRIGLFGLDASVTANIARAVSNIAQGLAAQTDA